jgi:hypothetical protein
MCRDRLSGRQSLPTPSSPSGKDAATRRGLHAGAKAVLLGAVALLGLVGSLHPGGPVILSIRPRGTVAPSTPRGTQTRRCPAGTWRVVVRRMIGPRQKGCQTADRPGLASASRPRGSLQDPTQRWPEANSGHSHGYPWGVCGNRLATASGAVLSSPGPRRRRRTRETPAGLMEGAQAAVVRPRPMDVDRMVRHPRTHPRDRGRRISSTVNPVRRSYRTNGRQAGLASRPG